MAVKMFKLPLTFCVLLRKNSKNDGLRGMATLKAISVRLKSVKNIQKITQSMKMVSAAKFTRAEKDLKQARPMGEGTKYFYEKAEIKSVEIPSGEKEENRKVLFVAITSDRGLCGAVHSSVTKVIRNSLKNPNDNIKIVCVGEKARSVLHRQYGKHFLFVCNEVGRLPPTFLDASKIAIEILATEFPFETAKIVYNRFRSVVSYATEQIQFYSLDTVLQSDKLQNYENIEDDNTILSFIEFTIVSFIFYAMKEGACSEQSSRMTAMDNASKNAGEMISNLTLSFNRTRQAVITRELIEIISGASAL